jgi:hypothetical protein
VYVDPSEGQAGKALDVLYGAAASGALKVDPSTGDTTLRFLNQVQDLAERMARQVREVSVKTPLGGGFGDEIGTFNQALAGGGTDSALAVLTRFGGELQMLKDAVKKSMESYRDTDAGNARTITNAGAGR